MNSNEEAIQVEIVAKIDHADREGQPLGNDLRRKLIPALEAALVDDDRLRRYLRVLQEVLNGHLRYDDAYCLENEDPIRAIAERGLMVLDDVGLTRLALNPIALCALSDHIAKSVFTNYWTEVSAQAYTERAEDSTRSESASQYSTISDMGSLDEAVHRAQSWADLVGFGSSLLRDAAAALARKARDGHIAARSEDQPSAYLSPSVAHDGLPTSKSGAAGSPVNFPEQHDWQIVDIAAREGHCDTAVPESNPFAPVFRRFVEEYQAREASYATAAAKPDDTLTEARADLAGQSFLVDGDNGTQVMLDFRLPAGEVWVRLARPFTSIGTYAGFELMIPGLSVPVTGDLMGTVGKTTLSRDQLDVLIAQRGMIAVSLIAKNGVRRTVQLGQIYEH
jgi:hypothetical protein